MLRQHDTYWKERQRDLDDLSDRLLRVLSGRLKSSEDGSGLPPDVILVARTMGPAELLDYDRSRLRGLVVEDGSSQSHVAVVAKALGIAAIGQAIGIVDRVTAGDAAIVDAVTGEVHLRPTSELITAYSDKVRFRARRQKRYQALRDRPAVTKDGIRISLMMNAGLLVDMPHLAESGADGIGLYRTELQFMLSESFPRLDRQTQLYRAVIEEAGGRPVVFRTLDVGGDKILPYLRQPKEENPAMGWRAIRMSLDRPELFRLQMRAMLKAAAGSELKIMIPMVSAAYELGAIRALIDRGRLRPGDRLPAERELATQIGVSRPSVRAGLHALAAMGVVRSRHGSGTYIPDGPPLLGSEPLSFLAALHGFTRPLDRVNAGRHASSVDMHLPPIGRDHLRIDARDDALRTKAARCFGQQLRPPKCRRVDAHLVGAGAKRGVDVFDGADATADRQRDEESLRGTARER